MVGVNTVLKDDPELTCRNSPGISPIRIVCDTHLKTPLTSKLVQTAGEAPEQCRTPRTIIATAVKNESLLAPYKEAGVEILRIEEDKDNHISLKSLKIVLYVSVRFFPYNMKMKKRQKNNL